MQRVFHFSSRLSKALSSTTPFHVTSNSPKFSYQIRRAAMSTRKALVHGQTKGSVEVRSDVPTPKLRDEYIIVKPKAVALNPTDFKSALWSPNPGAIVGCDYAGIVEEVGSKVTVPYKKGDRVAGFVRGAHPNFQEGAFAETIIAQGDIALRVADNIPWEQAATLGVGITTVGQGLFQSLGLPLPPNKVTEPTTILIYGGSTATGTLAIQYAKLVGATVIVTASPHNFDLVKSRGADQVFDYKDPDVGAKIRAATNDSLKLVFDTISEGSSIPISAAALSSTGGHYSSILRVDSFPRPDIKSSFTLAYTAFGEDFSERFPKKIEDREFGAKFWALSEELINSGKVKAHPVEVREGGFNAIAQGLEDLKEGRVSGVKLVYRAE